jgi:hypothetical protein
MKYLEAVNPVTFARSDRMFRIKIHAQLEATLIRLIYLMNHNVLFARLVSTVPWHQVKCIVVLQVCLSLSTIFVCNVFGIFLGYYCPIGSSAPVACPPGTNTSAYGLISRSDCQPCLKGFYCPLSATVLATRPCEKGYFCPTGTANPTLSDDLLCPIGNSCPTASATPQPCKQGSYQDEKGRSDCKLCPAGRYSSMVESKSLVDCVMTPPGFYSIMGSIEPTGLCQPGHYCPISSSSPTQVPCPSRYYRPEYGGAAVSDCALCVAGYF